MKQAKNTATLTFARPLTSISAMKKLINAVSVLSKSGIVVSEIKTDMVRYGAQTPKATRRKSAKRGAKRVLSPAKRAAIAKAQAARWAGHKKK